MAQLLRTLGLKPAGGNYINMKRNLQRLGVDTKHWTGQAWSKDQQQKSLDSYVLASALKPHLIRARGHRCQSCKLMSWQSQPIPLELHHRDGNRGNNREDNLLLLCPN